MLNTQIPAVSSCINTLLPFTAETVPVSITALAVVVLASDIVIAIGATTAIWLSILLLNTTVILPWALTSAFKASLTVTCESIKLETISGTKNPVKVSPPVATKSGAFTFSVSVSLTIVPSLSLVMLSTLCPCTSGVVIVPSVATTAALYDGFDESYMNFTPEIWIPLPPSWTACSKMNLSCAPVIFVVQTVLSKGIRLNIVPTVTSPAGIGLNLIPPLFTIPTSAGDAG